MTRRTSARRGPRFTEYRHDSMGAVRLSRRLTWPAVAAALATSVISACSSGGSSGPSATPSPSANPASQLQALATAGLQQSYTAIYGLRATKPAGSARLTIGRTPTAYRLNVQRGRSVAVLIRN